MFKKLLAISAFCLLLLSSTVNATVWYADATNGSDSNVGSTYTAPFKTIQKAFSRASAGDTIIVNPGVYYGPFNFTAKGTASSHITIKAKDKGEGKTILTNANKTIRENVNKNLWVKNDSSNTWVTSYTLTPGASVYGDNYIFPARLLCDDVDMLQFASLQELKTGMYGDKKVLDSGYFYDNSNHKLFVRLRTDGKYGSANPNDHVIKVSPSVYSEIKTGSLLNYFHGVDTYGNIIGEDSYNLCIGTYDGSAATSTTVAPSYYVDIDGFTFETPGNTGILLRASDVTVKNCWFKGCRAGIRGAARSNSDMMYSNNITIQNCDYSQYPITEDTREIINELGTSGNFSWWMRKGELSEQSKYFNYEKGGFVTYMGKNWAIRKNNIHDCFDGISFLAMMSYKDGDTEIPAENIEISGNVFKNCVDNGIELENHSKNIEIFDNEFENNFIPISYQPLGGAPWPSNIRIYKNIIHNSRDFNNLFGVTAGKKTAIFKIGIDVTKNGFETDPEEFVIPNNGVKVFNNTIVSPGARLFENVSGSGKSYIPFRNIEFTNNVIVCGANSLKDFGFGMARAQILYREDTGIEFSHNVFSLDSLKRVSQFTDNMLTDGVYVYDADEIGFNGLSRLSIDPTIKADSVLIGAGTTDAGVPEMSSTVGALGYGQSFHNYVVGVNN